VVWAGKSVARAMGWGVGGGGRGLLGGRRGREGGGGRNEREEGEKRGREKKRQKRKKRRKRLEQQESVEDRRFYNRYRAFSITLNAAFQYRHDGFSQRPYHVCSTRC